MIIPSNPLVPEVADVAASAVSDVNNVVYEKCDYVLCFKYVPLNEQICHGCNKSFLPIVGICCSSVLKLHLICG